MDSRLIQTGWMIPSESYSDDHMGFAVLLVKETWSG